MKWIRETVVTAGGFTFHYQGYEIHFKVDFDDSEDPDVAEVTIYNLSPDTENNIELGSDFVLQSGFKQDFGTILEGIITDVHAFPDGTERVCKIEAVDSTDEKLNQWYTETYEPGTKASTVLEDVIGQTGLEIAQMDLEEDVEYKRGFHVDGKIREIIKDVAKNDGESKCYVVNGSIYCVPWDYGEELGIVLNQHTGLIGTPTRIQGDHDERMWDVSAVMEYRIRAGMKIQVQSETANGTFLVKKGSHISNRSEHITKIEIAEPASGGGGTSVPKKDGVTPYSPSPDQTLAMERPGGDPLTGGGGGGFSGGKGTFR